MTFKFSHKYICTFYFICMKFRSLVNVVSDYRLDNWGFDPWQRQMIFPLAPVSSAALRPT
jgi:hypothetical protein